jgi:SMP-30/Gluconolactonase/LRE-like region/Secretion system C-terminal sorting domain
MKKLLILLAFLFTNGLQAQTLSGPESVDYDTLTNTYYVGNTISREILRRKTDGTWAAFVSGVSGGPYGIEVVGDRIYACAGTKIKGYKLSDGVEVFSANTTGQFLNGLTHDDNGFLYATDFSGKRIYKVNIATATSSVFVPTMTVTPNGIIYEKDKNRLVLVTWGSNAKVMAVSLADSTVSTLKTTPFSNIDGVALDRAGRFYVAHWGGNAVHRYEPDFLQPPVSVATNLSSPADIYYNQKTDTLAIPNSSGNTVRFIGFQPVLALNHAEKLESIAIYPNPATSFVTFHSLNERITSVQITDVLGRSVVIPTQRQIGKYLLDIRQLDSGYHQVVVFGEGGAVAVGRFLKQ